MTKSSFDSKVVMDIQDGFRAHKEAEGIVTIETPREPTYVWPTVPAHFKLAGQQLNMCPYEMQCIVEHAIVSQNDMVMEAFKKFLTTAKLALDDQELPLKIPRQLVRTTMERHTKQREDYEEARLRSIRSVMDKKKSIQSAEMRIRNRWTQLVDGVARNLDEAKNVVKKLPVWDRMFVLAVDRLYEDIRVVRGKLMMNAKMLDHVRNKIALGDLRTILNDTGHMHREWIRQQLDDNIEDDPDIKRLKETIENLWKHQTTRFYRRDRYGHLYDTWGGQYQDNMFHDQHQQLAAALSAKIRSKRRGVILEKRKLNEDGYDETYDAEENRNDELEAQSIVERAQFQAQELEHYIRMAERARSQGPLDWDYYDDVIDDFLDNESPDE